MKKRTKNILLILGALGLVVGAWTVWYVFYKPHRDVGGEKPAYTLKSDALQKEFEDDGALAKYIDQAVLIEGNISEVGPTYVTMGNVVCNFEPTAAPAFEDLKAGSQAKVQGRVSTFNDLLGEIVVDKCVLKPL